MLSFKLLGAPSTALAVCVRPVQTRPLPHPVNDLRCPVRTTGVTLVQLQRLLEKLPGAQHRDQVEKKGLGGAPAQLLCGDERKGSCSHSEANAKQQSPLR